VIFGDQHARSSHVCVSDVRNLVANVFSAGAR
jgi:hypothetical protein